MKYITNNEPHTHGLIRDNNCYQGNQKAHERQVHVGLIKAEALCYQAAYNLSYMVYEKH